MKKLNMRRMSYLVAFALIAAVTPGMAIEKSGDNTESGEATGPAYGIINSKSTLHWEGTKPGGNHVGTIEVINGAAHADGGVISGGSFEIDMSSIRNEDIKKEDMRNKLVGHLKSEDFFYVEKYPKATFIITKVEKGSGATQTITGDLTIRGNTNEISFPAEVSVDDNMIHASTGKITLNRTLWEVNHMSKSVFAEIKDRFIDDEMVVKLDLHFSRN